MPSGNTAFEVFVKRAMEQLHADAKGRSDKMRELRDETTEFLDQLDQLDDQVQVVCPLPQALTTMLMSPLMLGCESQQPVVEETALGILHKLVAHAWLQGETSVHGLHTEQNAVTQTVHAAVCCADSMSSSVHLSVVRVLLTITTSEHFVPHGDTLVQCMKTVFNLAIASEDLIIKRTSCNALLQMINTTVKRIAHRVARHASSSASQTAGEHVEDGDASASVPATPRSPSSNPPKKATMNNRTAQLSALAEQRDLRGLEAALEAIPSERIESTMTSKNSPQSILVTPVNQKDVQSSAKSQTLQIDVLEADMVVVLSALCKLAAREVPASRDDADLYVLSGKHLALELLSKVLETKSHPWQLVPARVWSMLRQPLCLVLLRCSAISDQKAFPMAARLMVMLLRQPALRTSLKAEMGAFMPLLLLRPLEADSVPNTALMAALSSAAQICEDPQLLVDIFVNYDCDLQATNVFERCMCGLRRILMHTDTTSTAAQATLIRELAISCICTVLSSLDTWTVSMRAPVATDLAPSALENGSFSAEHFEAQKIMKDMRTAGMLLFESKPLKGIRMLQDAKVVGISPAEVALWARVNLKDINRDALGELFGMSDDFCVATMHSYIDQDEYSGMPLDVALRILLREFKLPGEAQQIDRIMEKFAECYCRCNPSVFEHPDDAYKLAFATIMLNTDVHNPMAEHMLGIDTFIGMNTDTGEDGLPRTALPVADLEGIYQRIQNQEIQMLGHTESDKAAAQKVKGRGLTASRLARALGLTNVMAQFRSGNTTAMATIRDSNELKKIQLGSSHWYTARTVEHVRHMFQAAGSTILEALKLGLQTHYADDMYTTVLHSSRICIRLTSQMSLPTLCEDVMTALCNATGVYNPAEAGTDDEARQVQALHMLLCLGTGPEASTLGPSWWLLLRCVSALEELQATLQMQHIAFLDATSVSGISAAEQAISQSFAQVEAGVKSIFTGVQAILHMTPPSDRATALANNALFNSPKARQRSDGARNGTGAGLVQWAFDGEGAALIDGVYSHSASLDGDAIITFMGALCAVSQQELQPMVGQFPRVWSLQKVVECSFHNVGRIRLVWSRIWAIVSPHMVATACHEDPSVAMTAVDALKQLVTQLLQRSELVTFRWQQDALASFVAILRHSGDTVVRELVVRCLQHILQTCPNSIGSGWNRVLQALEIAVSDSKLALATTGIQTLSLAVAAASESGMMLQLNHRFCEVAARAALNNSQPHLCLEALNCLTNCGQALAAEGAGMPDQEEEEDSRRIGSAVPGVSTTQPTGNSDANSSTSSLPPLRITWSNSDHCWSVLMHAFAHIALYASNPSAAEQAVSEAMRMLHQNATKWSAPTLRACFDCTIETLFTMQPSDSKSPRSPHTPQQPASPAYSSQDPVSPPSHGDVTLQRHITRVTTHLPDIITLVLANYSALGHGRLHNVLHILLTLIQLDSEFAVHAGMHKLLFLINTIHRDTALDRPGWQTISDSLCTVSTSDCITGVFTPTSDPPLPPLTPTELRLRCITTVFAQRLISTLLTRVDVHIPAAVSTCLLAALQGTVSRATTFNRSNALQIAAANRLGGNFVLRESELQMPRAGSDVTSPRHVTSSSASPLDDSEQRGGGVSPPISPGTNPGSPRETQRAYATQPSSAASLQNANDCAQPPTPQRTMKVAESGSCEQQLPSLMRQEAEGGVLLISAYLATVQSYRARGMNGDGDEAMKCADGAEEQLLVLCRSIIDSSSADSALTKSGDWTAAVHAPLLCASLKAFYTVSGSSLVTELKNILPGLCKLMCSAQPSVRCTLADVLDEVIWPVILAQVGQPAASF